MLWFLLVMAIWPPAAFRHYIWAYREHHRVALAWPGEPYDFGHDWTRLRQTLEEPQTEPWLEAQRLAAGRAFRRHQWLSGGILVLLLALGWVALLNR